MFHHLLVPLDGSRLAETALPAAVYLARTLGASISLIHIVERDAPGEVHGERHLTESGEARAYLEEVVSRGLFAGMNVDRHIEAGESGAVARRIQEYSDSAGIDLIVICTHGRHGLTHLLLGSNAQKMVAIGTIPVLQVRPAEHEGQPFDLRRILTPLDGRPEHEKGLEVAASLARACGSDLRILCVVPTMRTLRGEKAVAARLSPRASSALLDISLEEAEQNVRRLTGKLEQEGIRASGGILRGDPAEEILREVPRSQADLIVVATHRKAGADAFWSASVAPKVTLRSPVPVLLIPLAEKD